MAILAGYIVPHPPIIIPEIGGKERRNINQTIVAYHKIAQEIVKYKPDTLIITTPHAKGYRDVCVVSESESITGDFGMFGVPDITFNIRTNKDLVERIIEFGGKKNIPIVGDNRRDHTLDHGTMVPLYFLRELLPYVTIVRISTSGLPTSKHYQIGSMIDPVLQDTERVVWIASGDLSHKLKEDGPYGFRKEGPMFDESFTTLLKQNKLKDVTSLDNMVHEKAAVCGLGSFAMLFGAVSNMDVTTDLLSYEGPFGVGYAVASITPMQISPHVQLAKRAIWYYVSKHKYLPLDDDICKELIHYQAGVFVSIKKDNKLRGCIGTTQPTTASIALEIIHNAVAAASRDYRFTPIKINELDDLEISVDILYPSESIQSIDDLDVKKYGVIVHSGYRTGLLLPNLEGVDTEEYQVSIALRKASIHPDEPYQMERFEVRRYY